MIHLIQLIDTCCLYSISDSPDTLDTSDQPHVVIMVHLIHLMHLIDTCCLPPQAIGSVFTGIMQAIGAAEKVFELIDRVPEIDHKAGKFQPAELKGRVEFQNVWFSYPTRPDVQVLKGITFTAQPGEVVALVGELYLLALSITSFSYSLLSSLSLSVFFITLFPLPSFSR